jgi:hypothetical protein
MSEHIKEFRNFVSELQGQQVSTLSGRASFRVTVSEDGFTYFPKSSEKPRFHANKHLDRILDLHRERGSLSPQDYNKDTMNASYILALIGNFYAGAIPLSVGSCNQIDCDSREEGLMVERKSFATKRNRTLAAERKRLDEYMCQACDFSLWVGGNFVVECHHRFPLGSNKVRTTKITDLVSLCPTCHRVAHSRNPPFDIAEIRRLVGA